MYALWPMRPLLAQSAAGHRFVACFLDGGWDVLLAGDPRDPAGSYEGIDLGLNMLAAEYRDPFPVSMGGTEQLWGPTLRALEAARRPRDLLPRHQHEHRLARDREVL